MSSINTPFACTVAVAGVRERDLDVGSAYSVRSIVQSSYPLLDPVAAFQIRSCRDGAHVPSPLSVW